MDEIEAEQFVNDMLKGMVYVRQQKPEFNQPGRHSAILTAYNQIYYRGERDG